VQVEPAVQVDPTGAMHAGPGADRLAELVSGRP
jgi:hypothetical protein